MSDETTDPVPPGWPHGPWATIVELRARSDAANIECQQVVSGRWKSLADRRWDSCVIQVPWRFAEQNADSVPSDPANLVLRGPHAGTVVCNVPLGYYSPDEARQRARQITADADAMDAHAAEQNDGSSP